MNRLSPLVRSTTTNLRSSTRRVSIIRDAHLLKCVNYSVVSKPTQPSFIGRGCSLINRPKSDNLPSFRQFCTQTSKLQLKDVPKDEVYNVTDAISSKIGRNLHLQKHHPLNILKNRIEQYFKSLPSKVPFETFDNLSPVVSTKSNFDDMLFPKDHESRRPTDTYFINKTTVLRTHTSAHQTELMKKGKFAFLVSGDVYRRDEIDATHYPVFHQMEGVRVFTQDEIGIPFENAADQIKYIEQDMKKDLEGVVAAIFGKPLPFRWVEGYFPFTDPSWELEIFYNDKWLEVLGCGVIHQDILRNISLGDRRGWAFGIGIERLAMALFDIPDIRYFWSEDSRFLKQFTSENIVKFKPYSKFPPCIKDISFWVPSQYHANDFFELVRGIGGDLIESVTLHDKFVHPKTNKESHCYRINFRSMERSLTNEEINSLQEEIRKKVVEKLNVELR